VRYGRDRLPVTVQQVGSQKSESPDAIFVKDEILKGLKRGVAMARPQGMSVMVNVPWI